MRGQHPNSQKNLKKFKEGESGNPSGRSKAFSKLRDTLQALADEYIDGEGDMSFSIDEPSGTRRELVHHAIWDKAQDGDKWAILLLERLGCLD